MGRIMLNIRYIFRNTNEWTVRIFAIFGLIGTFASLSDLWDVIIPNLSTWKRVLCSASVLLLVWILLALFFSLMVLFKNKTQLLELNGGKHVYVQYGDIFSDKIIEDCEQKRVIVIPANRCFDVIVDDELVSESTLQGQALKKLYLNEQFTDQSMNAFIEKQLSENRCHYEELKADDKRRGNKKRYDAGTVVEIEDKVNNCIYFFLGLSKFDYDLRASTSSEEYVLAIMRLLEYLDRRSGGKPVVLPLIGGGLSKTCQPEEKILGYIKKMVEMHKDLIHGDLHIVVRITGDKSIRINKI